MAKTLPFDTDAPNSLWLLRVEAFFVSSKVANFTSVCLKGQTGTNQFQQSMLTTQNPSAGHVFTRIEFYVTELQLNP